MPSARWIVGAALLVLGSVASAQVAESAKAARGLRPQPGAVPNDRQALQRRVRQAFSGVVRRQLNLNPSQMQALQRVDQKYEQQRRAVLRDERDARLSLKTAMQDSTGHPDQDRVAQYLDRLVHGQRQRADLLEAEQKELSTFLSPMQRAQYFSLKERVARKLLELQTDSTGGRAGRRGLAPPEP